MDRRWQVRGWASFVFGGRRDGPANLDHLAHAALPVLPSPFLPVLGSDSATMIRKNDSSSTALSKRARVEDEPEGPTMTVAIGSTSSGGKPEAGALIRTVKRTSGLEAPIVSLSGAHGVRALALW